MIGINFIDASCAHKKYFSAYLLKHYSVGAL